MIVVSMRIHPGEGKADVVDIERRLRQCAEDERWTVETLQVWQPADESAIALLKSALDRGVGFRAKPGVPGPLPTAPCPTCGRAVQVREGRLARHRDRALKRLCRGSGGTVRPS